MNEPVLAKLDAAQDRVLAQLERILVSGCLGQAESLNRLLRYLVLETLAGRSHRLKEYTLGVEVFQRGPDFDPRVDTIVRTQARRLRAKLQEFYSADRKPGEIVIELSKGSYVPRFHETAPAQPAQGSRMRRRHRRKRTNNCSDSRRVDPTSARNDRCRRVG